MEEHEKRRISCGCLTRNLFDALIWIYTRRSLVRKCGILFAAFFSLYFRILIVLHPPFEYPLKRNDRLFSIVWHISLPFSVSLSFPFSIFHPGFISSFIQLEFLLTLLCFLSIRLVVDFYMRNRLCEQIFSSRFLFP